MLATIRSTVATWFVKILFGVLIASFAIWGIGDIFRGGFSADAEVAEVGGASITRQALDREFRREVNRLRPAFGGDLDLERARSLGLLDRALDQLIVRALYGLEQDKLGMAVSEAQVKAAILQQPAFRNDLGQFDRQQFEFLLRQLGLSEAEYVALSRIDIARQQVVEAIAAGARAPATLVEAIYAYREETRVADTVEVASATLEVPPPDDAAIKQYYDQNPDRFTAPEYRTISYVPIEVEEIAKEINVPKEDIESTYEDRRAEFTVVMLQQGRPFAEVARELAGQQDPAQLALGSFARAGFPLPEAADAVFALAEGGFTDPVTSPLGRHVFRVTKIEPGRVVGLEEVRDELAAELARERALDVVFELSNKLEDELAGGASLEQAAGRLSLAVNRVADLARAGTLKDGSTPPPAVASPEFLSAAFDTYQGEESPLGETADGNFFILRVDGVTAPAVRPLDEVREAVIGLVTAERKQAAAETVAVEIVDAMKGGKTLEAAAADRGLAVKASESFTRDGRSTGLRLPPALVAEMFAASPGGVATAATASGFMVARLKQVRAAEATGDAAKKAIGETLDQAVRDDLLGQFTSFLRGRYSVSVRQAAVDSLFLQQ
jgi:peptidyl-prolyl cis-trans isomerase D